MTLKNFGSLYPAFPYTYTHPHTHPPTHMHPPFTSLHPPTSHPPGIYYRFITKSLHYIKNVKMPKIDQIRYSYDHCRIEGALAPPP